MKIKYFAWIRELTKIDEEHLDSNEIKNLKKLKKFLVTKYPDLQKHFDQEVLRFAVVLLELTTQVGAWSSVLVILIVTLSVTLLPVVSVTVKVNASLFEPKL